jgi:cytochrome P450
VLVRAPEHSALWWLGRAGLFTLNGEQHKQERRLVMPAFHKKQIETYYDEVVRLTNDRLAAWKIGETYNLYNELFRITQDISISALFGLDTPADVDMMRDLFNEWVQLSLTAELIPINHPALPYGRLLKLSERLKNQMLALIETKRKSTAEHKDILSLLIQGRREDGSSLTDDEIVSEINVFWNTNETTASVLVWVIFLLLQHPSTMMQLMGEFDEHLQGNPPTLEQIYQLPVLDRVIKESMRIFPAGNFLTTRISTEPFNLGPYHLPKGTKIVISPFVSHHLPENYEDPNTFSPDRWLTINPSPYQYLPFGAGTRYCIGAPLANFEMRILVPMLMQKFRLALQPNLRVDRHERPILRPKNGLPITVHMQDRQFNKTPVQGNVHEIVNL